MESLGNKLKTAREEKKYSLEQICQETNMAMRYLEALEQENFDVFPGEAYTLGFLKNYSIYLDLDVNELLSLYRALKIQEQQVPMEAILRPPSQVPKILGIIVLILIILGLIVAAVWYFAPQFLMSGPVGYNPSVRSPMEFIMNTNSLERRFYLGDTILVPLGAESYRLQLTALGDTVTLNTDKGQIRLDLSQEVRVDLDNDGFAELRIIVADFARNDSSAGALIRIELESVPWLEPLEISSLEGSNVGSQGNVVIFSSSNPYPFTLQVVFLAYCLFRWEVLFEPSRAGRNEHYYQQFDELSIQAQNGIRIGLSNANAVRLQVIGGGRTVDLDPGGPGEVVVADIRWFRDEANLYRLVFARLE